MDLKKIGACLRDLRKNKGITQEQLAERFNVSQRTVSRWETGSVMPDMDVLILLSDFYEVDLRSLLNGDLVDKKMDPEIKETMQEVAKYDKEKDRAFKKTLRIALIIIASVAALGIILWAAFSAVKCTNSFVTDLRNGIEESEGCRFAKSYLESSEEVLASTGQIHSISMENGILHSGIDSEGSYKSGQFMFRVNEDKLVYISIEKRNDQWRATEWRIEVAHSQP